MSIGSGMWVVILGGVAGLVASLIINALQVRVNRRNEAVADFSQALSDALGWIEFVYIIHRRHPGIEESGRIRDRMNDSQLRLVHHRSWLRIESPSVHKAFNHLVISIQTGCKELMRAGWEKEPSSSDGDKNLRGSVKVPSFEDAVDRYVDAVKKHLRFYLLKIWR